MPKGIYIRSEETKRKLRILRLGRKHTKEHKDMIRKIALERGYGKWMAGRKLSLETKLKISQSNIGRIGYMINKHHSIETKRKMSESQKRIGNKPPVMFGYKNPRWTGRVFDREERRKRLLTYRHLLGISKRYREDIIGFPKSYHRKRRKYHLKLAGDLSLDTIRKVYEDNIKIYGFLTCYLCGKPINNDDSLEHKTPISRGGTNKYENLGIAHRVCNCKKGKKTVEEYLLIGGKNVKSNRSCKRGFKEA